MGLAQFSKSYPNVGMGKINLIKLFGVMKNRIQAIGTNIGTNALYHLQRAQGLTKNSLSQLTTLGRNNIALIPKCGHKIIKLELTCLIFEIDSTHFQFFHSILR